MEYRVFNLKMEERFGLLDLLPQQGNFATLGLIEGLRKELVPSEEDFKEMGIEENEGKIKWVREKDKGKNVEIGPKLFDIIFKLLDDNEKGGRLKSQHYTLFEKIAIPHREEEAAELEKGKSKE